MKTILVIEDEVQTLNIFLRCLEFEGFRACGAKGGSEGIELARSCQPDLIVCDILMPDLDGYGVLSTLRRSPATAGIPFIFLTAKVTMVELRQGMELGADDYLTKPCTVEQFLAAIATRLQRQEDLRQFQQDIHRDSSHSHHSFATNQSISEFENPETCFPHCDNLENLETVFQFIEAHYQEPLKLEDVAKAAGYAPAYLTNLIQKETGRSVKQWIIERRMRQARQLLQSTTDSVCKVAELSGYPDPGYFSSQFRRIHGTSPLVWRKKVREKA